MRKANLTSNVARASLQLAGTLALLTWVPGNGAKAALLLLWWLLTFESLDLSAFALFALANVIFTGMNILSLRNGVFRFLSPDAFGLPWYEFFMWGFYLLHASRTVLRGKNAESIRPAVWPLVIAFSACFACAPTPGMLLASSAAVLAIGLIVFHSPGDLRSVSYMILLGMAIEYTGVWCGQWIYPNPPVGGVPLWFVTLWGGVGLFLHRLAYPLFLTGRWTVQMQSTLPSGWSDAKTQEALHD